MKREEVLFDEAIECGTPAAAAAYLDQACATDEGLRQRVQRLLAAHWGSDSLIDGPLQVAVATQDVAPAVTERRGDQIGPYKLIQQIGEGGMGVVHMAQQTEPVKRLVALKIIKPGMDSRQVIARFEAERQALALMDHPNIAKVLDAGTVGEERRERGTGNRGQGESIEQTPSSPVPRSLSPAAGRPYFVMELVRGIPITKYCDEKGLTPKERLELFIPVCHAVQHAHQKGIIHRDLKPTNVLIAQYDSRPVPKVIDFGVAKATGGQLTEKTLVTNFGSLVGTLEYMSPEQAELNQLDVDTRSDIYALGVLLYELLTGGTPFDRQRLKSAAFDEMLRIIREEEPETVSQRLAKTRSANGDKMRSAEFGMRSKGRRFFIPHPALRTPHLPELDWIVMKALEKDRSRRYESASAFAADIQRYLEGEPVLACPPTALYRFQKFAKKHKPAFATAAALALCLLLGITLSLWQALRATAAEAQANANEAQAQTSAQEAKEKAQEATAQRDEAQKQRDENKALAENLAAKEHQLQRTLYSAHINLAQHAWDAGDTERVRELLAQHRPNPEEADLRGFEWHYFYRLYNQEILTLKGHEGAVTSVAFSPDGRRLASGDWNYPSTGTVKVWDAQTGKELLSLKGETPRIYTVAFSADGKRLASADGKAVKVWDAQSGQELLSRENINVRRVMFSPDGEQLVSGDDKTVRFWDAQTGQELRSFDGIGASITFSPDGRRLASSDGNALKVRELKSGQELLTINDSGRILAFSPDGNRLACGLTVWDAQTGEKLLTLQGPGGGMSFSPDGKRLVSGSKVWDAHTGRELLTFTPSRSVSFSPDGKRLIGADETKVVKVWDAETGQELIAYRGHAAEIMNLAISADGKRLASASLDKTVKIWDAEPVPNPLTLKGEEKAEFGSVTFSPDGNRLASASGVWDTAAKAYVAGEVKVWNALTGQQLFALKGHTDKVNAVVFSADGKHLASASRDNTVKVWDSQTGRMLLTFTGHAVRVSGVAFSPDGKRLASAAGGEFKVWDAQSGVEILTLKASGGFAFGPAGKRGPAGPGPGGALGSGGSNVTFSPDGKRIVSVAQPGVKVWDAQSGEELFTCKAPAGSPAAFISQARNVVFSPDGKRIASPYGDNTVKVWDAQTGEELLTFKGHSDRVYSIAFSADGKRLASGSDDKTVRIWDAQTGVELISRMGHDGRVNSVAFSPDGHRLGIASGGSVKIYDATPLPDKP